MEVEVAALGIDKWGQRYCKDTVNHANEKTVWSAVAPDQFVAQYSLHTNQNLRNRATLWSRHHVKSV